ncbi:MAG: hypothetical protein ACRC4L_03170 [Mycoplasma sp.]
MKNRSNIIYIQDIIPSLPNSTQFKKEISNNYNLLFFKWKFTYDNLDEFKMENLILQLTKFLDSKKNIKYTVILNGFSSMIFRYIHKDYLENIEKLIIVNPFDEMSYLQGINIKSKMLPQTIKLAIYKYIYLSYSLENLRDNENWIKSVREEVKELSKSKLVYHKILDQLIRYKELNKYFYWIKNMNQENILIVGRQNPLINIKFFRSLINNKNLNIIENCGYCIEWEQPMKLISIIKKSVK